MKTKSNKAAPKSKSTGREATKHVEATDEVADMYLEPVKQTKNDNMVIDITKLSAADLAMLQKQLREMKAETSSKRSERNEIVVSMLAEKDEDGNFTNTTREISFALARNGMCEFLTEENFETEAMKEEVEKEIRKVQAKKQQLEKATDEKGNLVHPEGTYGYKASRTGGGGAGNSNLAASKVRVETIVRFFESRAGELSKEQKAAVLAALK